MATYGAMDDQPKIRDDDGLNTPQLPGSESPISSSKFIASSKIVAIAGLIFTVLGGLLITTHGARGEEGTCVSSFKSG
jgi:hypothetical protein